MASYKCRVCGEAVLMAETASGKQMPLDPTPSSGYQISMNAAGRYSCEAVEVYQPHACAQPKLVRKQ